MSLRGSVLDVFTSLQGEGLRLGEKQVFVRFGGCNIRCDYCDEPGAIPILSGERASLGEVRKKVLWERTLHPEVSSCSVTGGEPLLHTVFLEEFLPWLRNQGFFVSLETNGVLYRAFEKIAPSCDAVAMDLKFPSATRRKFWDAHRLFIRMAPDKIFVKVVLTEKSTQEEFMEAVSLVEKVHPAIPFILQPVTPVAGVVPPEPRLVLSWMRKAKKSLEKVLLIPQWHPVWKLP